MRTARVYVPDYLSWLRTLPCAVCCSNITVDAAHIRFSDARIGKVNPGVGNKPHDFFAVPLCRDCHDEQHGMNEGVFWRKYDRDPLLISLSLFAVFNTTKDAWDAERIIYGLTRNVLSAG